MPTDPTPSVEPPDMFAVQKSWMPRALMVFAVLLLGLAAFGVYMNYRAIPFDPVRWQESNGSERGRMLASLLEQTDFIGYSRREVRVYLGTADHDERFFWYDLGPDSGSAPPDARGSVGDPDRLYGIFQYNQMTEISEVLYSHHRPLLGW
jgi:hypothetical protein